MLRNTYYYQFMKAVAIVGKLPYEESKFYFKSDKMRRKQTQKLLHNQYLICKRDNKTKYYKLTDKGKKLLLCDAQLMYLNFYITGQKYTNMPSNNRITHSRMISRASIITKMIVAEIIIQIFDKPDIFDVYKSVRKTSILLLNNYLLDNPFSLEDIYQYDYLEFSDFKDYSIQELSCIASNNLISYLKGKLSLNTKIPKYLKQVNEPENVHVFHNINNVQVDKPLFYCSLEIKMDNRFKRANLSGSRSLGTLLTRRAIYIVYNLGDSLIKWSSNLETGMKAAVGTALYKGGYSKLYSKEHTSFDYIKGLFFVENTEVITKVIINSNSSKNNIWIKIDHTFQHWHFIENSIYGIEQLKIMSNISLEKKLLTNIKETDNIILSKKNDGSDGIDKVTLRKICFLYDLDILKMLSFKESLLKDNTKGIIYCLPYQEKLIDEIFDDMVTIKIII